MTNLRQLNLIALYGIPRVQAGDDLVGLLLAALESNSLCLENGDVIVLAQKIVSKAEGRLVNLSQVQPRPEARELAEYIQKRAELVELILQESNAVLRTRPGTIIVEHKSGFVCANAGIDHSNVSGPWGNAEDWVLLLPEDSDASAAHIRNGLETKTGKSIGVLIIDSHGRAWRNGIVGVSIGAAGIPALVDMRGETDMNGYQLRVTTIAAADELAAAASLLMGQAAEGTPAVLVQGFPYGLSGGKASDLVRSKAQDLFR